MQIKEKVYEQLVKISKKHKPQEASAMLFNDNTIVEELNNDEQSVVHFVGNNEAQLRLIQKYGLPSALFHSHPCSATPSSTDKLYMKYTIPGYDCVWLIMSDNFNLRAWTLDCNNKPKEIDLVIE